MGTHLPPRDPLSAEECTFCGCFNISAAGRNFRGGTHFPVRDAHFPLRGTLSTEEHTFRKGMHFPQRYTLFPEGTHFLRGNTCYAEGHSFCTFFKGTQFPRKERTYIQWGDAFLWKNALSAEGHNFRRETRFPQNYSLSEGKTIFPWRD